MDQKNNRILLFLGSLFVAVIFLSSYASFGNGLSATSSTTTIGAVRTYPAFGSSSARITGYGAAAFVRLNPGTAATTGQITKILSKLESNGSINSYVGSNSSYEVYTASMDAYTLRGVLQTAKNNSATVGVSSDVDLLLPSNITLHSNGYSFSVHLDNRNYSANMTDLKAIGTLINVSVSALVTANGTVYRNQIVVNLSP